MKRKDVMGCHPNEELGAAHYFMQPLHIYEEYQDASRLWYSYPSYYNTSSPDFHYAKRTTPRSAGIIVT